MNDDFCCFVSFSAVVVIKRSGTQSTGQVDLVNRTKTTSWVESVDVEMVPTASCISSSDVEVSSIQDDLASIVPLARIWHLKEDIFISAGQILAMSYSVKMV